jgi:hypothetical protein
MADTRQINVTDLDLITGTSLTSDYQILAFTTDGDTNRINFDSAVAKANSNNGCVCFQEASLTIASADVLQLNTTPLTIVAAQGAGTAIELISATFKGTFNSIAYATNTDIDIRTTGSSVNLTTNVAKLGFTANTLNAFALKADPSADQMIENTGLEVFVETGDPTAGDSDITVYVTYRVITL